MGWVIACCLASVVSQAEPKRIYSSPIEWAPSVTYALANATSGKKFILVYIGSPKEKREPRVFLYSESVKAARATWMFVDLYPDPNDPWQKRWGVKRTPTVVGCDRHGNAFQVTPSLSRPGLQRIYKLVPYLALQYEARLKRDLAAALDALESRPKKAVSELTRLVREGRYGYTDVATALEKVEEIAKPDFIRGELAESVSFDHAVEFYADLAKRFEGTPPGVRAALKKARLDWKREEFDTAITTARNVLSLDSRRFTKERAAALALLEKIARGPEQKPSETGRFPLPTGKGFVRSVGLYRELYGSNLANLDRAELGKVARDLLAKGIALDTFPVGAWYLLGESRELAAKIAEPKTALDAVKVIAERFEVDEVALMQRTLETMVRFKLSPEESRVIASAHLRAADTIMRIDPDAALDILNAAEPLARKAKDLGLIGAARRKTVLVKTFKAMADRVAEIERVLSNEPDNEPANLEIGRYRCLYQRRWTEGLPLLARGSAGALREAAQADLSEPKGGAERLALGDRWWTLADAQTLKPLRLSMLIRSARGYLGAWAQVDTLDRVKIEERLKQVIAEAPEAGITLPSVKVLTLAEFTAISNRYPKSADLAAMGTASASSQYSKLDPQDVFGAERTGTAWALDDPTGWFSAEWDPYVTGRTILLFGRSTKPGKDPWGEATITLNEKVMLTLTGMTGSTVAIVELGDPVDIRSLLIQVDGKKHPGLASVEIHP